MAPPTVAGASDTSEQAARMIDVLWIARFDYTPGQAVRTHEHAFHQLIHAIDGDAALHLAATPRGLATGEGVLLPPGTPHAMEAGASGLATLDVKFKVTDPDLAEALGDAPVGFAGEIAEAQTMVLRQMLGVADRPTRWRQARLGAILCAALLATIDQPALATPQLDLPPTADPACLALLAVIERQMHDWPGKEAVARLTGYSYRHLADRCRAVWGLSPTELLHRRRVRRALGPLSDPARSIRAVAEAVGYQTPQHFSRHFKALMSQTPGSWRSGHGHREHAVAPDFVNTLHLIDPPAKA